MLRRRSLARLRKEAEPVPAAVLGRFLPAWHGIEESSGPDTGGGRGRGAGSGGGGGWRRRADAGSVLEAIERLAGAPVPGRGAGDAGAAGPGARLLPRAA